MGLGRFASSKTASNKPFTVISLCEVHRGARESGVLKVRRERPVR